MSQSVHYSRGCVRCPVSDVQWGAQVLVDLWSGPLSVAAPMSWGLRRRETCGWVCAACNGWKWAGRKRLLLPSQRLEMGGLWDVRSARVARKRLTPSHWAGLGRISGKGAAHHSSSTVGALAGCLAGVRALGLEMGGRHPKGALQCTVNAWLWTRWRGYAKCACTRGTVYIPWVCVGWPLCPTRELSRNVPLVSCACLTFVMVSQNWWPWGKQRVSDC